MREVKVGQVKIIASTTAFAVAGAAFTAFTSLAAALSLAIVDALAGAATLALAIVLNTDLVAMHGRQF